MKGTRTVFLGFFLLTAASARADDLKVTVVDVGQGDAIHIQTPSGKNYLIDGGDTSSRSTPPALNDSTQDFAPIVRYLLANKIYTLDWILKTNDDHDHYFGLQEVLGTKNTAGGTNTFTVKAVIYASQTVKLSNLSFHPETARVPVSAGTRLEDVAALSGLWDPALAGLILSPRSVSAPQDSNDGSVVMRLLYGRISFLFTGDVGDDLSSGNTQKIETNLLADYPGELRSTVLKVGHHGSRTSSTSAFLDVVKPRIAVVSSANTTGFGLPDAEVLQRIADKGATVYGTYDDGDVTVETNGVSVSVKTALTATDTAVVSAEPTVHVYPNPAPGTNSPAKATVVYALNGLCDDARVSVYTVSGALVRSWSGVSRAVGDNHLDWDLKNGDGEDVASGLYFVQVEARAAGGGLTGRCKMAVLRK